MSFISKFKDATIGFSGYPRLARDPSGGFGYLALLLLLVLAISALISTVQMRRFTGVVRHHMEQGPDFYIQDGRFVYTGPMPQRVEAEGVVLVIDTTGATTPDQIKNLAPNALLLTADRLYQVQPGGQVQVTELAQIPVNIGKKELFSLMEVLYWVVPLFYILIYIAQLLFKAIDALILALLAMLVGNIARRRVAFEVGWRLGLYAMTLPILIQWILPNFTTLSARGFLLWWGIAIFYLVMGLRAYFASQDEPPGMYEI